MVAIEPSLLRFTIHGLDSRSHLLGRHRIHTQGDYMALWREQTGIQKLFPIEGGIGNPVHVNDTNQVVYGESRPSRWGRFARMFSRPRERFVLWDPNRGKIELGRYLPWRLRKSFIALDINNQGCIVGYAMRGDKTGLTILLEPIEENWEKWGIARSTGSRGSGNGGGGGAFCWR